jgi:hypothetical protein
MTRHRLVALMACSVAALALAGLHRQSPTITEVAPNPASTSTAAQSVTVTGRDFADRLSLSVTGPDGGIRAYPDNSVTTRRESSFQAMIFLTTPGAYRLVVTNPDGQVSAPFVLNARNQATAPSVTGLKPLPLSKSTSPQTITVEGARFVAGLSVMVTDPAGNVQTIQPSGIPQVEPDHFPVSVTLELTGDYGLVVVNPNGQTSNTFAFRVDQR